MGQAESVHRFTIKGRTYTKDDPCLFRDRCIPGDRVNWGNHAGAWLSILAARANTPQRIATVHRMVGQWAEVLRRKCMDCRDDVEALIAIAELAEAYATQWSSSAVTPPDIGTGWYPIPNLPLHPDLPQTPGDPNQGGGMDWIWIVLIVGLVWWASEQKCRI